ncbi:hypothetical protein D3C71_1918750 [compost metagenome]
MQEPCAQALLKPRDALADRRARQAQSFGGNGEALRVGHAHEREDIADVVDAAAAGRGRGVEIVHESSLLFLLLATLSANWNQ